MDCFGGGIGRHEGLKIPWAAMPVRVQVPSEALISPSGMFFHRDSVPNPVAPRALPGFTSSSDNNNNIHENGRFYGLFCTMM